MARNIRPPIKTPRKQPLRAPFDYSGAAAAAPSATPLSQMLYVSEGDSITTGNGVPSFARLYLDNNLGRVWLQNVAVGGSTIADVTSRAAAADALLTSYAEYPSRDKVLTLLVGANDMLVTSTTTFLADLAAYCDARRTAGWKVGLGTVLPRGAASGGSGTTEAWRATVNAAIRSWVGVHCDVVMDFATDLYMGSFAETALSTYYDAAGLHPTAAGQVRMYDIAKFAISSLSTVHAPEAQYSGWSGTNKSADITVSGAGYVAGSNVAGAWRMARGALGRESGKYKAEFLIGGSTDCMFGVTNKNAPFTTWGNGPVTPDAQGNWLPTISLWPGGSGLFVYNMTQVNAPPLTGWAVGNVGELYIDFDAGKAWIAKNNAFTSGGNPATGANPNFTFPPNTLMFLSGSFNAAAGTLTLPTNAGALAYPLLTGWSAF